MLPGASNSIESYSSVKIVTKQQSNVVKKDRGKEPKENKLALLDFLTGEVVTWESSGVTNQTPHTPFGIFTKVTSFLV